MSQAMSGTVLERLRDVACRYSGWLLPLLGAGSAICINLLPPSLLGRIAAMMAISVLGGVIGTMLRPKGTVVACALYSGGTWVVGLVRVLWKGEYGLVSFVSVVGVVLVTAFMPALCGRRLYRLLAAGGSLLVAAILYCAGLLGLIIGYGLGVLLVGELLREGALSNYEQAVAAMGAGAVALMAVCAGARLGLQYACQRSMFGRIYAAQHASGFHDIMDNMTRVIALLRAHKLDGKWRPLRRNSVFGSRQSDGEKLLPTPDIGELMLVRDSAERGAGLASHDMTTQLSELKRDCARIRDFSIACAYRLSLRLWLWVGVGVAVGTLQRLLGG